MAMIRLLLSLLGILFSSIVSSIQATDDAAAGSNNDRKTTLKVVFLAGQSNVFGFGSMEHLELLRNENGDYDYLWNGTGYKERSDVYVRYLQKYAPTQGPWRRNTFHNLVVVEWFRNKWFGLEVGMGWTLGDALDDDVLILKYAVGGTYLYTDFRPPSSVSSSSSTNTTVGESYTGMIDFFTESLNTIQEYAPNYDDYQVSGFVWFQGTSDYGKWEATNEYFINLRNFLRDVRKDLNEPDLPFVIAGLGETRKEGEELSKQTGDGAKRIVAMRDAQRNVTLLPENKGGKAVYVGTAEYHRYNASLPMYDGGYHYYGRADSYMEMGNAFGEALLEIIDSNSDTSQHDSGTPDPAAESSTTASMGVVTKSWGLRLTSIIAAVVCLSSLVC